MSDLLSGTPNNFWGYSAVLLKGIKNSFCIDDTAAVIVGKVFEYEKGVPEHINNEF